MPVEVRLQNLKVEVCTLPGLTGSVCVNQSRSDGGPENVGIENLLDGPVCNVDAFDPPMMSPFIEAELVKAPALVAARQKLTAEVCGIGEEVRLKALGRGFPPRPVATLLSLGI